jgi:DNA-binding response OmpR family regulator
VATVLVIEDERKLRELLRSYLERDGLAVLSAGTGAEGLSLALETEPDLVVLDLGLPDIPGEAVATELRRVSSMPIVILTAKADEADRVRGLELGADDYVTKPFSPRELMARVQAALRRRQKPRTMVTFKFGDCEVDFSRMSARRAGKPITMTAHEFKLLKYFVENAERVLSREELLNEVWGYNSYPTTRTVDNQILKLRQKLEPDAAEPRHLQTIYGAGYKFVP